MTKYEYYNTEDDSGYSIYGINWYGQTFTPTISHTIKSVKLKLHKNGSPTGTLTVSIRATSSGLPTGSDLCSGTISASSLTTTPTWYEISLGDGVTLNVGTQYAIIVRDPSDTDYNNAPIWWADASNSVYSGGTSVSSNDSGSSWTINTTVDFMFEEWGEPLILFEKYNAGDDAGSPTYDDYYIGQTFTPTTSHTIKSVRLKLHKNGSPTGTLTVSVRATSGGLPTGSDLCSGTISASSLTTTPTWYEISLGNGANLTADTQYAIIIKDPSDASYENAPVWGNDTSSPTYSGGSYVASDNGGSSWWANSGYDMMFEEYGEANIPITDSASGSDALSLTKTTEKIVNFIMGMSYNVVQKTYRVIAWAMSMAFESLATLVFPKMVDFAMSMSVSIDKLQNKVASYIINMSFNFSRIATMARAITYQMIISFISFPSRLYMQVVDFMMSISTSISYIITNAFFQTVNFVMSMSLKTTTSARVFYLYWSRIFNPDILGYRIYEATDPYGTWTLKTTTTEFHYIRSLLVQGHLWIKVVPYTSRGELTPVILKGVKYD